MKRAVLALADGTVFEGRAFGSFEDAQDVIGEVVFNTSMYGYQEILTDPSYAGQIVTMAYPEMGNVGANAQDEESDRIQAVGMVTREFSEASSNWRASETLDAYLRRYKVAGISGVDTRALVRHLRTHGAQMGVVSSGKHSPKALAEWAAKAPGIEGRDLVSELSTKVVYEWNQSTPDVLNEGVAHPPSSQGARLRVVAYDFGLKRSMLQFLVDVGCSVTVVPAHYPAEEVLGRKPDGVFLTNGPGDPSAVAGVDRTVATLLGKVPIFGICLGHQMLARGLGGKTYRMKFGHRGANQPVQDLTTGKIEITSHNHGFAVDVASLAGKARVTHLNLNDKTVEGLEVPDAKAFSVQYHPESSPGPHDARYLFKRFARLMTG